MNSEAVHDIEKNKCSSNIIIEIHVGIGRTLSKSLKSSKMNNTIKFVCAKEFFERFSISNIDLVKIWNIAKNRMNSIEHFTRAINQIIENNGPISSLLKSHDRMRTDIPETSGNKE